MRNTSGAPSGGAPPGQSASTPIWKVHTDSRALSRYVRLLIGLLWFAWADWMTSSSDRGAVPLIAVITAGASIAVIAIAILVHGEESERRFDLALLVGSVLIMSFVSVALGSSRAFGTDEIALDQGAAIQLLHGVNPYGSDLSFALRQFGVPIGTVTLDGSVVSTVSYPSLSFLLYVPAVAAFGANSYGASLVNLACWAFTAVVLWRLTAPTARTWVALLFALPLFFGPVTGGNVDTLYLPFLLIALFRWDRYADPDEHSIARWVGPVALGVACAVKQNPWLLAPFLVIGVGFEARGRGQYALRVMARYALTALVVFLAFNLPFLVWDAPAWWQAVSGPFTGGLIPSGIGPVDLIRSYGIGGGALWLFTAASLTALLAAFCVFVWEYERAKRLLPLLPLAALFVSSRSLPTYFAFSVPLIAVGAMSVAQRAVGSSAAVRRVARPLGAVAAAAAAASLLAALSVPPPLHVAVTSAHPGTTLALEVRVDNGAMSPATPHFVLAQGRDVRLPLQVRSGPATIAPGSSSIYSLSTADGSVPIRAGDEYQVQVFTADPSTMSVTPLLRLSG